MAIGERVNFKNDCNDSDKIQIHFAAKIIVSNRC
jgi:hypothetical protein